MSDSTAEGDQDPADRPEPEMERAMDRAGVPRSRRAKNAGGDMSETQRSRTDDPDLKPAASPVTDRDPDQHPAGHDEPIVDDREP